MIDRFIQYSLEHRRPIRLLVQKDKSGQFVYMNLTVIERTEDALFCLRTGKSGLNRPPLQIALNSVIAADYARGDHGDTLQYEKEDS